MRRSLTPSTGHHPKRQAFTTAHPHSQFTNTVCSRGSQIAYRLTVCPELSLGVFLTVIPQRAAKLGLETLPYAKPVETGRVDGAVSVLLAHIIATRCRGDIITDADMAYPKEWRSQAGRAAGQDVGHQEGGRTVGIHSLAVLPRVHRCGIGQTIMKAYLDQMKCCGLVDRVALICQDVSPPPRCAWKEWWA
jgi:GNAT superfamily N-acetyltransferase